MSRTTRHVGTALLWIAIALLPLRGLAVTLMPALASPSTPLMAAAADMPCHGAAADQAAQDEPAAAPMADCASCSLCALCHASVAQACAASIELPALPALAPAAAPPSAIEPRAPDGLFRPPRTTLA